MKTFRIEDGDLVLEAGSFREVTGSTKLVQDLSHAMREPLGCDRYHPRWGSNLPSYIGQPASDLTALEVRAEAKRVIDNHMAVQQDFISRDVANGRPSRYGSGEVINDVDDVQTRLEYDSLHVRCVLRTLTNEELVLLATVRV